ncbi:MAG TPA: MBL fold metallo-hydrolase [Terriglobia bacterium]|nr:MBL fold metallo-hydrolase [Terriglobia bacterium]
MMTGRLFGVAALALTLANVATAQDARTVVANATKAMGYGDLNTIEYSGPLAYEGAGIGQWQGPATGWHQQTLRNYTRFIDIAAGTSQRTGTQSRPGDPATGLLPGGGGLDPSNSESPNTCTVAATGAWSSRFDVTLSPPAFLRMAAAASDLTARAQTVGGKRFTVVSFSTDQKAPSGVAYRLSGYIDDQNMLDKVETGYEDSAPFLIGDILVEQTFSGYKTFGAVKFPTRITQKRGEVVWNDTMIASVTPNAPAPAAAGGAACGVGGGGGRGGGAPRGGAAPGGGRGAAPGGAGPGGGAPGAGRGGAPGGGPGAGPGARGGRGNNLAAQGGAGARGGGAAGTPVRKLADGVFQVGGGYRVLAVEFKDHIVMVDAPQNGIADFIEQTRQAIPNKPITAVISTHNHFDHSGGLRVVAAEGATIVTNEMNKPIFEKWFSNPRTLQASGGGWPDALEQSGKKAKFKYVKDKLVMKDETRTVEIYALKGVLHSQDMMVVYLPREKIVFQSDAYNPGNPGAPTTGTGQLAFQKLLASELDRLKLDYNLLVAAHQPSSGDRDVTKQDLFTAIGRAN